MNLKKNRGVPRREADIDPTSLNVLLVIFAAIILMLIILASYFAITLTAQEEPPSTEKETTDTSLPDEEATYPFRVNDIIIEVPDTDDAKNIIAKDFMNSEKAILIDLTTNEIVASRQAGQVMYPASMTKVMTLIVVAENLKNESALNDVLTVNVPIGEHSGFGFSIGDTLTVKDLIYAAILQSDGVACIMLANYIAGSETNFVKLMNEKAREMGLDEKTTLFQNCTGLHEQYHYSTCRDMAIIMAYAMKNPFCASVLTTLKYSPSGNFRPGNTYTFWNGFLHNRLSDGNKQPKNAEIIGGKTGWTGKDSGYCIVSYVKGNNGHFYVSVTSKAESWDANVQDIINIFNEYVK